MCQYAALASYTKKVQRYTPLQHGIPDAQRHVVYYQERAPKGAMRDIIHCYWVLKTQKTLTEDFVYTVMPDACIDIVFDTTKRSLPIIMTPHLQVDTINLGTSFYYAGIRFKPGVVQKKAINIHEIVGGHVETDQLGEVSLKQTMNMLAQARGEQGLYDILESLAERIVDSKCASRNHLIERTIMSLREGKSVDEVARISGYSSRQIQRIVFDHTGFSPVQLQRVMRFQDVLSSSGETLRFADESHLIKEFNAITGMSYKSFINTFT
jgi:hypothetical protein